MAYTSLDEWLDEIEIYASRRERLAADCDLSFVMPWLETAWRLGGEAKAKADAERIAELEKALRNLVAWQAPIELCAPELGGAMRAFYEARAALSASRSQEGT